MSVVATESGPSTQVANRRRTPAAGSLVAGILLGLASLLIATAVVAAGFGMRWFDVSTPSMGTAAPVGSLVVTVPTSGEELRTGDIIAFHPPGTVKTYTHRIVAVASEGAVQTRGDLNGAEDPWTLHDADLIGRVVSVLPVLGWLVRGLPWLVLGTTIVLLASTLPRSARARAVVRLLGLTFVVSLVTAILRPFVAFRVLTSHSAAPGVDAHLVSTGILPIEVGQPGHPGLFLTSGEAATLHTVPVEFGAKIVLNAVPALSLLQWTTLIAVCLLPLVWCVTIGLPVTAREEEL